MLTIDYIVCPGTHYDMCLYLTNVTRVVLVLIVHLHLTFPRVRGSILHLYKIVYCNNVSL